jgi:hypothetical protein
MRAALYARVSTSAGHDPTVQLRELRECCDRRGWEIGAELTVATARAAFPDACMRKTFRNRSPYLTDRPDPTAHTSACAKNTYFSAGLFLNTTALLIIDSGPKASQTYLVRAACVIVAV